MAAAEANVVFIEFDCGLGSDHFNRHGREKPAHSESGGNKVSKAKLFLGKTGCEWKQRCLEVAERECRIQGMFISVFNETNKEVKLQQREAGN